MMTAILLNRRAGIGGSDAAERVPRVPNVTARIAAVPGGVAPVPGRLPPSPTRLLPFPVSFLPSSAPLAPLPVRDALLPDRLVRYRSVLAAAGPGSAIATRSDPGFTSRTDLCRIPSIRTMAIRFPAEFRMTNPWCRPGRQRIPVRRRLRPQSRPMIHNRSRLVPRRNCYLTRGLRARSHPMLHYRAPMPCRCCDCCLNRRKNRRRSTPRGFCLRPRSRLAARSRSGRSKTTRSDRHSTRIGVSTVSDRFAVKTGSRRRFVRGGLNTDSSITLRPV